MESPWFSYTRPLRITVIMQSISHCVYTGSTLKTGRFWSALLFRLPLFGGSVLIYSLGLLLSGWLANGDPQRIFWLGVSVAVFWLTWLTGKKPVYLYYV